MTRVEAFGAYWNVDTTTGATVIRPAYADQDLTEYLSAKVLDHIMDAYENPAPVEYSAGRELRDDEARATR